MRDIHKDIIVLTSFLKSCNSDFELDFSENDIESIFESKISYNDINQTLYFFEEQNVLSITRGGEDGFAEEFHIKIRKEECFNFLQEYYNQYHTDLLDRINKQTTELKDIYGFLPENIVQEINDSKSSLNDIVNSIKGSEFLKPLEPKIKEINEYLDKTEKVIKNYENIYINIIKPIKSEGKQGIRATTIWAILSIVITTIISIYLSYKTFNQQPILNELNSNLNKTSNREIKENPNESNQIEEIENKVNFLIREHTGLNSNFKISESNFELKYFDLKVLFISKSDTVIVESYSFNDYKTDNSCYSNAGLKFYINKRMITTNMLKETFQLKTTVERDAYYNNQIKVIEGDTLVFNNMQVVIDRILSTDSECNPIGDKYNAVIIRNIK